MCATASHPESSYFAREQRIDPYYLSVIYLHYKRQVRQNKLRRKQNKAANYCSSRFASVQVLGRRKVIGRGKYRHNMKAIPEVTIERDERLKILFSSCIRNFDGVGVSFSRVFYSRATGGAKATLQHSF